MKFTKSLPAKASASENVPNKTMMRNTFTLHQCNTCISRVKKMKQPKINSELWSLIHVSVSGDI